MYFVEGREFVALYKMWVCLQPIRFIVDSVKSKIKLNISKTSILMLSYVCL
jgi:hypothetical protein